MVEWKKLGTLSDIGTGSNNREDACENGLYPFYVRSKEVLRINSYLYDEEAILIPGEGGVGEIFHYVNGKYGLHQRTYRVHPILKIVKGKYLYYYLYENFGKYINQKSFKSTAASIRKPMLLDFPVAIPSLPEQTRIVGILDTFTASIENLKEQIAERRKQYEYYRDQLLDLEGKEGVEMKTLGEISEVITGGEVPDNTIKGQEFPSDSHPYAVYTNGKETYGYTDSYQVDSDAVCISSIGANTGAIFYKTGKFTPAIRLKVLIPHENVNTRFLYYSAMSIDFKGRNTGSVPNINANYVKSKTILLPSLEEQSRIVSILDTFESSIQNLEAQLKEREKQYEYYRNKLLTFE